jgi:hypothetical protein
MSAPITEAHRELAATALFSRDAAGRLLTAPMTAQLIADSEAAAVQTTMLREYGNLCATNESLAKERDQLRAETERLTAACDKFSNSEIVQGDWKARAERAEAELAELLAVNATGAARLAHATAQLATEREKVRALRLACERIVAQWDADHDTNPIGAGGLMYTRASFALAATEDAQ